MRTHTDSTLTARVTQPVIIRVNYMRMRTFIVALAPALLAFVSSNVWAQSAVFEDFTGTVTTNPWFYSGGACLTASGTAGTGTEFTTSTTGTSGTIPGCTAIRSNSDAYGGETLVGGYNNSLPDPTGSGALRFTNGCINGSCGSGGHNQFGAIISGNTFASSAGVQVTFKTVTYRGDSLGSGADGADGISFFLMDGSVTPEHRAVRRQSCVHLLEPERQLRLYGHGRCVHRPRHR